MNRFGTTPSNKIVERHQIAATNGYDHMVGLGTILRQALATYPDVAGKWNDGEPTFVGGLKVSAASPTSQNYIATILAVHDLAMLHQLLPQKAFTDVVYKTSEDEVHTLIHIILASWLWLQSSESRCAVPFVSDFPVCDAFDDLLSVVKIVRDSET